MTESLTLSLHLDIGGFPSGSDGKESACNAGNLIPGSGRSSGEGHGNHSNILAWKINGQSILVGYSLWGPKESDSTEVTA